MAFRILDYFLKQLLGQCNWSEGLSQITFFMVSFNIVSMCSSGWISRELSNYIGEKNQKLALI